MWLFDWLFSKQRKEFIEFKPEWYSYLDKHIYYYQRLSTEEKVEFEVRLHTFLSNTVITGIGTKVEELDKVLIGASAIIPIFGFKDWEYPNLKEILLYPNAFDHKFNTEGEGRTIFGMVGTGYMDGKMILSKKALHHGFSNQTDKKNTAIHEFIHLIDKADGLIDGVPKISLENEHIIPWIDLIQKKTAEIYLNNSDINPYGATDPHEFITVVGEYFFERPHLLSKKHPKLYDIMARIFKQDISKTMRFKKRNIKEVGRNDPCPCGSGIKYKKCCGGKN